ncbi:MAG: hypothetical protein K2X86_15150 [Cytophagaceae bacterium]|nr:hypothetical protein [Cytophagaceae bacterium]
MKKSPVLLFILFSLFPLISYSQIKTPDKRPFNIGIFSGIGGLNFTPIPGLDLHYKGTLLRLAPGYRVYGGGVIREIMPLSEVFYNWYWIASLYGAVGKEDYLHGPATKTKVTSTYYKGIFLTGAKVYFSLRWYSQLQGGIAYTQYKTPGFSSDESFSPYFEFTLGLNLFKSYVNELNFQ